MPGPCNPLGQRAVQPVAMHPLQSGASTLTERRQLPGKHDQETVEVALAQSGDSRAFERLYRAHVNRVHSLVRRMVPDADAEELTQDVFVRAWQKLAGFRGEAAFGTWLHRLAVNLMLEHRAGLGRDRKRWSSDEAAITDQPARRVSIDEGMDMEDAVRQLPDGMRQVFVLYDVEGYQHDDIGTMLGISTGTSKSQLHRARMALRQLLLR
jgi:RNA polymerase sigma-70 factor (ECF subfamily)